MALPDNPSWAIDDCYDKTTGSVEKSLKPINPEALISNSAEIYIPPLDLTKTQPPVASWVPDDMLSGTVSPVTVVELH